MLHLPYFWDEAGYYIPAARDLLAGSLIPYSTPSNAHPPLVMAWLALAWKIFGEKQLVTRCAMLLLAAFSLTGFFRLARSVSNATVAVASTLLTMIYPVFFAQSSLAQVDLPAAGLTFWALDAYVRKRGVATAFWFSLAALAKETAILIPLALLAWELVGRTSAGKAAFKLGNIGTTGSRALPGSAKPRHINVASMRSSLLLISLIPLSLWYAYHYAHTGFVFGNPEFFRYNVQDNFHLLRIVLAFLLRIWQTTGYLNLYVLTLACLLAMTYPAQADSSQRSVSAASDAKLKNRDPKTNEQEPRAMNQGLRGRIEINVQLTYLAIGIVYLVALSVLGGAVLARYMLPVIPLFILICVSTIWRRLRAWKAVLAVIAFSFLLALFVNPPYGFSPEDNLAYRDYIRLHQRAETFLAARYPNARVLTAWPASDELSRPNLGYVSRAIPVVRIEDFTTEQLIAASDERARFDLALVFSTKYQPTKSFFDRWRRWQEWKSWYFGYHVDLSPEAAASVLGGSLVYVERRRGQWVGVIEMEKVEEALKARPSTSSNR